MSNKPHMKVPKKSFSDIKVFKKIIHVIGLSRYIAKTENISVVRQYIEIMTLFITRQLGPVLYYEAQLWKKKFSMKQKMRFLNSAQYKKRINELNMPAYRKFTNDKLAEKAILSLLGVPTAKFIGFFHCNNGSDSKNNALTTSEQLKSLLSKHIGKRLCFKLTEGWGGDGFIAVYISEFKGEILVSLLPSKDNPISIDVFCQQHLYKNYHNGIVIEEYIEQHQVLANFNTTSVNTVRMWLIQQDDKVKFIGAVLRVGRKNQIVDNSMQGGIICLIDPETGKILYGRNTNTIPEVFDTNPDSGAQLTDIQLPFWSECVEMAKSCLRTFPHTNFVGLDIAFSTTGPMIIELNQEPDKISARLFNKPLLDLLTYTDYID
jgi:uncharacterized protein (DUF2164 family)